MARCFVVLDWSGACDLRQALSRAREALILGGSSETVHELIRPPLAALVLAHEGGSPFLESAGDIVVDVGAAPDPGASIEFLSGCERALSARAAPPAIPPRPMRRCLIRWSAASRRLVVVSEPNGQAPLYVHRSDQRVSVASEPKAIWAVASPPLELDVDALLEMVELGQVLDERTLFREVRRVGPGLVLAFDREGMVSAPYHRIAFSDGRGGDVRCLASDLNRRLEQVLREHRRLLPRVSVALSGGLDSRHLLAASRTIWSDLDAITFGEPDSSDVTIAGQVAAIAGVPHHHLAPGPRFLSEWAGYATWRADGMLSCLHAHGMDAVIARSQHSPHLLNGAGGDILMGAFLRAGHLLLPGDPVRAARFLAGQASGTPATRALKPEVLARAATAPRATLEEILRRHPQRRLGNVLLSFWLLHRCARVTQLGLALEAPFVEHLTPFLDPSFVLEASRLPLEARFLSRVHRRALADLSPALAGVNWERIGAPPRWPWPLIGLAKLGRRLGVRARSRPAVDHARSLRTSERAWVEGLLLDPVTSSDGFFLPSYLREIVTEHVQGKSDRSREILVVVTLELWRRIFLTRDVSLAVRPEVPPSAAPKAPEHAGRDRVSVRA